MICWSHHVAFEMGDPSRVGEARRHAADVAYAMGMDEVQAGRLALVVTELGNNLVRHAVRGRLLIAARDNAEVEVVAIDKGPGIADLQRSMGDGFSTAGTPGTGLGAVRRLALQFDLHSRVPGGTALVARVPARDSRAATPDASVGGISIPVHTERVCGDRWAAAADGGITSLVVADGLGHGSDAAEAADAAIEAFAADPMAEPSAQLERIHARLRSTRGAAVLAVRLDAAASMVHICGAGNVVGRLVSGDSDRTLLTQHGTAGVQIRRPEQTSVAWPPHAILVVHTDGVETRWPPQLLHPVLRSDPALAAAVLMREHQRGRDDATAVVVRRKD